MGDPFGLLDALYGVAGPFLIPATLFALGLAGYAVLLALGRVGVLGAPDDGTVDDRPDAGPDADETGADETGTDGMDTDGAGTGGPDDRPRRV